VTSPTRVAVASPYWTLWEHTAGSDFRARRLQLARGAARALPGVEAVAVVDFADADEAVTAARAIQEASLDAVLVIQSMAVPPAWALAFLDALPRVPVVIWALHESGLERRSFDHAASASRRGRRRARCCRTADSRPGAPVQSRARATLGPRTTGRVARQRSGSRAASRARHRSRPDRAIGDETDPGTPRGRGARTPCAAQRPDRRVFEHRTMCRARTAHRRSGAVQRARVLRCARARTFEEDVTEGETLATVAARGLATARGCRRATQLDLAGGASTDTSAVTASHGDRPRRVLTRALTSRHPVHVDQRATSSRRWRC
jgi:hypothetical protein